jgi:hypothetical protein
MSEVGQPQRVPSLSKQTLDKRMVNIIGRKDQSDPTLVTHTEVVALDGQSFEIKNRQVFAGLNEAQIVFLEYLVSMTDAQQYLLKNTDSNIIMPLIFLAEHDIIPDDWSQGVRSLMLEVHPNVRSQRPWPKAPQSQMEEVHALMELHREGHSLLQASEAESSSRMESAGHLGAIFHALLHRSHNPEFQPAVDVIQILLNDYYNAGRAVFNEHAAKASILERMVFQDSQLNALAKDLDCSGDMISIAAKILAHMIIYPQVNLVGEWDFPDSLTADLFHAIGYPPARYQCDAMAAYTAGEDTEIGKKIAGQETLKKLQQDRSQPADTLSKFTATSVRVNLLVDSVRAATGIDLYQQAAVFPKLADAEFFSGFHERVTLGMAGHPELIINEIERWLLTPKNFNDVARFAMALLMISRLAVVRPVVSPGREYRPEITVHGDQSNQTVRLDAILASIPELARDPLSVPQQIATLNNGSLCLEVKTRLSFHGSLYPPEMVARRDLEHISRIVKTLADKEVLLNEIIVVYMSPGGIRKLKIPILDAAKGLLQNSPDRIESEWLAN